MSTYSLINLKLEESNKTWNDLCEYLGMPAQYAYNWRHGGNRSYMHRLEGIGKYLNVAVKDLKAVADRGEKGVAAKEAVRRRNAEEKAAQTETTDKLNAEDKPAAKEKAKTATKAETKAKEKAKTATKAETKAETKPAKAATKPTAKPEPKTTKSATKPTKAKEEAKPATTPAPTATVEIKEPTPEELLAEMQGLFMSLSHEAQIVLVNSAKLMGKGVISK